MCAEFLEVPYYYITNTARKQASCGVLIGTSEYSTCVEFSEVPLVSDGIECFEVGGAVIPLDEHGAIAGGLPLDVLQLKGEAVSAFRFLQ